MEDFLLDNKVQLSGKRQIGTDQLDIGQLNDPIVALSVEEVDERSAAVLISECNRVAHAGGLVAILLPVRHEQLNVTAQLLQRGVDIVEDLRLGRVRSTGASVDIDQRALLFALVLVEDPQGNVDAEAKGLDAVRVIVRRVVGVPGTLSWIG